MCSCRSVDQLPGNADSIASFAHTAFEHIANAKFTPDLLYVDGLAFVSKAGVSRDDEKRLGPRQAGNDVLDHAVGEIVLLRIGAQVGEGEYGDRGFIGEREGGLRRFFRVVGGCRTCGLLRFPDCSDETEALAWQGFDEALLLAGIADCAAGAIQAGRQRASETIRPSQMALMRSSLRTTRSLLRIR